MTRLRLIVLTLVYFGCPAVEATVAYSPAAAGYLPTLNWSMPKPADCYEIQRAAAFTRPYVWVPLVSMKPAKPAPPCPTGGPTPGMCCHAAATGIQPAQELCKWQGVVTQSVADQYFWHRARACDGGVTTATTCGGVCGGWTIEMNRIEAAVDPQ